MALSDAAKAGAAIFVGAVQFGVLLVISEIDYSVNGTNGFGYLHGYAYSVSANQVSDLGANCTSSGACYIPPSALLFDSSVALLGILVIVGAYYLQRAFRLKGATLLIFLTGIGAMGVGLAPETTGMLHDFFSLMVFLFAGLSAIVTYRLQRKPMAYFSVLLGLVTLVALVLYVGGTYLGLGPGGMERMVTYPALLWGVGFGSHLMGSSPAKA